MREKLRKVAVGVELVWYLTVLGYGLVALFSDDRNTQLLGILITLVCTVHTDLSKTLKEHRTVNIDGTALMKAFADALNRKPTKKRPTKAKD